MTINGLEKNMKKDETKKESVLYINHESRISRLETTVENINGTLIRLESKIDNFDKKIDNKFEALDKKIDAKYDVLDKKIDSKFESLDKKIDSRFHALDKKIDSRFIWTVGTLITVILALILKH